MFRLIRWGFILSCLGVGGFAGYQKLYPTMKFYPVVSSHPEGMKVEVRNNKVRLISPDGKALMELVADGRTFTVTQTTTNYGASVQGNKVRLVDADGTTVLCDMDYNGRIITVTNVHGLKVSELDIKINLGQ